MRRFHCHATSPGIAIGRIHRLRKRLVIPHFWIQDRSVEKEVKRFRLAVEQSRHQLSAIQEKMCRIQGHDQIKIIESHRLLLKDLMLVDSTIEHIRTSKINAEWALDKTLSALKLSFLKIEDAYFSDRLQDLQYVGHRILANLLEEKEESLVSALPQGGPFILIVHDISPADVVNLPRNRISGFIMEAGGETSHTAIIARALEIPALFGIKDVFDQVDDGEMAVLDGIKGLAVVAPPKSELTQYRLVQEKYKALDELLLQDIHLPAETKDGYRIRLDANMELLDEIPGILQHGAEGIGLYRTEYLFLNRFDTPSEEEQLKNYIAVLKKMSPRSVTIRTIDLGGENLGFGQEYEEQPNPALGMRAIRFCLRERQLFRTQLKALLRAGVTGNLRILIPLVSSLEEIRQVKKIIVDVEKELKRKRVRFQRNIPLGVMIEVPAAVMIAEALAREVSFFSIGTNDLLQYGLAIDRTNEMVDHLYTPYHPALLRMIDSTVQAANRAGIPISICGELAGNPLAIAFLLGMELESLSMNPISIPRVKKILRSMNRLDAKRMLAELLELTSATDIEKCLKREVGKTLPAPLKELRALSQH